MEKYRYGPQTTSKWTRNSASEFSTGCGKVVENEPQSARIDTRTTDSSRVILMCQKKTVEKFPQNR